MAVPRALDPATSLPVSGTAAVVALGQVATLPARAPPVYLLLVRWLGRWVRVPDDDDDPADEEAPATWPAARADDVALEADVGLGRGERDRAGA